MCSASTFVLMLLAGSAVFSSALVVPRKEMENGLWATEGHARARQVWRPVSRADGDQRIKLTFAIKQQNVGELEEALMAVSDPASPEYGQHLTREEVDAIVAPKPESISTVKRWLAAHDIVVTGATGNEDFLMADTIVSKAEALLGVTYWNYEATQTSSAFGRPQVKLSRRIVRTTGAYTVPVNVAAALDFVSPTIHFPRVKSTVIKQVPTNTNDDESPEDLFVTPEYLHKLYQVPNTTRSQNPSNTQAFASFLEQYYSPSDLQEFFRLFFNSSVGQTVAQSYGPNQPTMPGTEAELDIQYIMSVGAGTTTFAYYTAGRAPNPENEPFLDFLTFVAGQSVVPYVISISYGEDEKSVGTDYGGRVNTEFIKVGARGVSIMVAAGDDGAGGNCTASGRFSPDFPSGSPYITAVGGLVGGTAGSTPTGESTDAISGGGFSDYWPQPSWQKSAVAYYLANAQQLPPTANFNPTGRGYPDVAAQSEMFVVVQDGIPLPGVGGTSCASPTFSGVIGLLNDARISKGKKPLGFLNPLIYSIAPANANAFNDATEGANMGCDGFSAAFPAWKNWDAATGWGSPNYSLLKPIVEALP